MFTEKGDAFVGLFLPEPVGYSHRLSTLCVVDCYLQDILISTIGSDCKLQILDVYPEDEGKYACTAKNSAGETTTTCFISVEGEL